VSQSACARPSRRSRTPCVTRKLSKSAHPRGRQRQAHKKLTFAEQVARDNRPNYDDRMSSYMRNFVPGGTYFFTVVTAGRAPVFADESARRILGSVSRECLRRKPVNVLATVLLPDHFHCLWALPISDSTYSERLRWIKREFTRQWLATGGMEQSHTVSDQRRRGVWQRRFWEHTIRDEADLENHFDYIHYNPVKHGYVSSPRDWPWSTFHRWVCAGHYAADWGADGNYRAVAIEAGE
jgi:putative transposase